MKYALIIDGIVDTVSHEPVLQHVQAEDGSWSFIYEMEEVTQTFTVMEPYLDPETEEGSFRSVEHTVTRSVPKRDDVGKPIGVLDPAWVEVPDDVFGGFVKQGAAFVAPLAPPVAPGPTAKADLWRRATDAEATLMDAALAAQPVRIRRLYDAATTITRTDELWATLYGGMVGLFGQARADVLLAPSQ